VIYLAILVALIAFTVKAYYEIPSVEVRYGNVTIVGVKNIDPDEIKVVGNKIVVLYDNYTKLLTFDIPTRFEDISLFETLLCATIVFAIIGGLIVALMFQA